MSKREDLRPREAQRKPVANDKLWMPRPYDTAVALQMLFAFLLLYLPFSSGRDDARIYI